MLNCKILGLLFMLTVGIISLATAQQNSDSLGRTEALEFSTDRPGIAESPFIIPTRSLQLELGYNDEWSTDEPAVGIRIRTRFVTLSSLLLRFAVHERLELRLTSDLGYAQSQFGASTVKTDAGLQPLRLGVKANLAKNKGIVPELSVLAEFFLPKVASELYQLEKLGMSYRLIAQNALSSRMNICYNVGADFDYALDLISSMTPPPGSYEMTPFYMVGVDYALTDKLGAFVESYGYLGEANDHRWNAGLTYVAFERFQLDASFGAKYNSFDAGFFNFGASYRLFR